MRKLVILCALLGAFCAAHGQITLAGHSVVPSSTDSDHGLASVVIGDADCNVTSPSGCTVPSGTGPYRGTFIVTSSVSLTADRCLILPLSPGRAVYVKNSTTGGKQVCVKGSTGGSATFASGQSGVAFSDGTNYNVISANGGSTSLGLVIADGVTYTTIQAAYTAACAVSPNLDVYAPANSTVTDFAYGAPSYLIPTCTSQITDGRTGVNYGAQHNNNLFQPQTPRKDYYAREARMKIGQINANKNGANNANTGIPTVVQQVFGLLGDSVGRFASYYNLTFTSIGMGQAGMFMTAAHLGGQNNEQFFNLAQTAFNLNSNCAGTCTTAPNGTPDPSTPNGSSLTLGSTSTTGTLTFNMVAAQNGLDIRFRNMQQAAIWYLCDGRAATLTLQTSPDGVNYFNETVTTQPSSCAATGGIASVGVQGVGTGSGCSTLTIGATGGTGFVGTAFPNSLGQIDHVTVTSQGTGYNPYTSTITITGGSCSVNPTWGNIRTTNESIVYLPITHDGITNVKVSNSGDGVKILGWGLYNPNDNGIVIVDQTFGGTSIDSLFADSDSYYAPWYNNLPIADTVSVQPLDNSVEAGQTLGYWFGKINDRYTTLHSTKAASLLTQAACVAADYNWDTQCRPYTPDVAWISGYPAGNIPGPDTGGGASNFSVMQQVDIINRGGGNALYVDNSYSWISAQDSFRRAAFATADSTHMIAAGQMMQNENVQQLGILIPPSALISNPTYNTVHVGQGSATSPSVRFVKTDGGGFFWDSSSHQIRSNAGLVSEGTITSLPGVFTTPTTYIPVTGTTSATYMICGGAGPSLNPFSCTAQVSVTTGPTTLSTTNFIQFCLNRPITGAFSYSLIRLSGYTGASVVYSTSFYTNNTTPPCMTDSGQAGSAYNASHWNPTGAIRINAPGTAQDDNVWMAVRIPSGASDVFFEQANTLGGSSAGMQIKVQDAVTPTSYCGFHIGSSNSWAFAFICGNGFGNNRVLSLQPWQFQVGATNNPNMDFTAAAGFMTGTVPIFRIKANSSSGACPSGGCAIFVSPDAAFSGFLELFEDSAGTHKWGVKPTGLELFGNSTLITGAPGTGTDLRRSTGSYTSGDAVSTDAQGNFFDSGISLATLCSLTNLANCPTVGVAGSIASGTVTGAGACNAAVGMSTPSWWNSRSQVTVTYTVTPTSVGAVGLVFYPTNTGFPGGQFCNVTSSSITLTGNLTYVINAIGVP